MGETGQENHLWLAGLVAVSNHELLSWRLRKTPSLCKICEWNQNDWREYIPPNVYPMRQVVSAERFARNMFRKRKMLYWYLHKDNYERTNSRSLGAIRALECLFAAFGSYMFGGNLSKCSPAFRRLWCETMYLCLASSLNVWQTAPGCVRMEVARSTQTRPRTMSPNSYLIVCINHCRSLALTSATRGLSWTFPMSMLYTVVCMKVYMLWSVWSYVVPKTKWALKSSSNAPSELVDLQGITCLSRMIKKLWIRLFFSPTASKYGCLVLRITSACSTMLVLLWKQKK